MKFGDPSSECRDGGDQKMELMRKSGQKPSRGATANCSQEDQSQTFRGVCESGLGEVDLTNGQLEALI